MRIAFIVKGSRVTLAGARRLSVSAVRAIGATSPAPVAAR